MHDLVQGALSAFRQNFPGLHDQVYMDVSARGLISTPVRTAIDAYLDDRMTIGGDKPGMFRTVEASRAAFAQLINASADEVGIVKNISDGINAVATAIDWKPGEAVALCTSLEHPANILPWHNLARTRAVSLVQVPAAEGEIPVERLIAALDGRVRVVAVSSATFAPGFKTPLAELGRAARANGAILLVDGAQSLGVLELDVVAEHVDVLLASTQKGLLGLYGAGFVYVRRALAETLSPAYLSRLGVELASAHEATSSGFEDFAYAAGARRFDVGNYNYLGAVAAGQALRDLLAVGPAAIEAHALALAARLRAGVAAEGVPVMSPGDPAAASHIVAIGAALSDAHDAADDPEMLDLHRHLVAGRVAHSVRRGLLRLSLHAYNDIADVDRVIELVRRWRRR